LLEQQGEAGEQLLHLSFEDGEIGFGFGGSGGAQLVPQVGEDVGVDGAEAGQGLIRRAAPRRFRRSPHESVGHAADRGDHDHQWTLRRLPGHDLRHPAHPLRVPHGGAAELDHAHC
jgi:hypothetical protein